MFHSQLRRTSLCPPLRHSIYLFIVWPYRTTRRLDWRLTWRCLFRPSVTVYV